MTVTGTDHLRDARELTDALLRAGRGAQQKLAQIAARHGLTAQQVLLLRSLDQPIAMSTLAEAQGCDPSNVTGLVDRTTRLGLVQRQPAPDDRRVRLLSLTDAGRETRDLIEGELAQEISISFAGTSSEQAQLSELLRRF